MVQGIRVGRRAVGMAVGVMLAVAGCSSGGGDGAATEPATTAPTSSPPPKFSTEWRPRLDDLHATKATAICQNPTTQVCADALTDIIVGIGGLQRAIEDAEAEDVYVNTLEQIGKMDAASTAYVDDRCLGGDRSRSGCYGHALDITVGVPTLDMALSTDESRAGL